MGDGQRALRRFEQSPPAVVILDLMLTARVDAVDRLLGLDTMPSELRDVSDRTIYSHIKNLHRKIQVTEPGFDCIARVYGVGYRFELMRPDPSLHAMRHRFTRAASEVSQVLPSVGYSVPTLMRASEPAAHTKLPA